MDYEAIIGMEVHAQLKTASKMFCGCDANYAAAPPNTHVCPVCLGLPGALPVMNRVAIEYVLMAGLALNCAIPEEAKFDRKNYPYPDLVKGYQISQYDMPLSRDGWIEIRLEDGTAKRIRIRRAHLEEDTGKSTHMGAYSLVDYNRSGMPLMEVVTEPDIRSGAEAWAYLTKLRAILRYLGIASGNMEEGAMRCEVNISLRPAGSAAFGTKVEVKNLNSFRSVRQSIDYEIKRQAAILDAGGQVEQVTMGWDENAGRTVVQRSKEEANDYRYFPEPDLPVVRARRAWVDELRARLPELPDARQERLIAAGLRPYDAQVLTEEREVAEYVDAALSAGQAAGADARSISNWIMGELFRLLKESGQDIATIQVAPGELAALVGLVNRGAINAAAGKQVLEEMFATGRPAAVIVEARGLAQISDSSELERIVEEAIAANPKAVQDYREGKKAAVGFLTGQVMRASRGKANPQVVSELLRAKLG